MSYSVEQAVRYLETMCEEYGDEFPLDRVSLYQHVRALLANEEVIPGSPPTKIVERCIDALVGLRTGCGIAPLEQWRAAAKWAFVLYRDYFEEDPATGKEDPYQTLTIAVQILLRIKSGKLPWLC